MPEFKELIYKHDLLLCMNEKNNEISVVEFEI